MGASVNAKKANLTFINAYTAIHTRSTLKKLRMTNRIRKEYIRGIPFNSSTR